MIKYIIAVLLLFVPCTAFGHSKVGTTYTTDGSYSDVNSALSDADSGDTINIPSGTFEWTSQLSIIKAVSIIGAGKTLTQLTHSYAGTLISVAPGSDVIVRISGIHFYQTTNNGSYSAVKVTGSKTEAYNLSQIRIDNNKFTKGVRSIYASGRVEGLIDNNEFLNCNIAVLVVGDNDYAWARTIAAGTEHALFIEDNTFTINNDADREPNEQIYHQEGGRTVIRYNTFDGDAYTTGSSLFLDSHGNWPYYDDVGYAYRGQPLIEIYENDFDGYQSYRIVNIRGGSLLIYNNTFDLVSGSAFLSVTEEDCWQTYLFTPLDEAWPSEDAITNTFIWGNTFNGDAQDSADIIAKNIDSECTALDTPHGCCTGSGTGTCDNDFIQEDRDYFLHAPLAAAGGTDGISTYTDRAGAAGNAADGTLTWTDDVDNAYFPYTAYQYPHPLQNTGVVTGTVFTGGGAIENDIVTGGIVTIEITLTGATWHADIASAGAQFDALKAGITGDDIEATGWNAVVRTNLDPADVVRDSDIKITITLGAEPTFAISANVRVEITVAAACTSHDAAIVASPTFIVSNTEAPVTAKGGSAAYNAGGNTVSYNADGLSIKSE